MKDLAIGLDEKDRVDWAATNSREYRERVSIANCGFVAAFRSHEKLLSTTLARRLDDPVGDAVFIRSEHLGRHARMDEIHPRQVALIEPLPRRPMTIARRGHVADRHQEIFLDVLRHFLLS